MIDAQIFAGQFYTKDFDKGVPIRFLLRDEVPFTYATIEGDKVILTEISGEKKEVELEYVLKALNSYIRRNSL